MTRRYATLMLLLTLSCGPRDFADRCADEIEEADRLNTKGDAPGDQCNACAPRDDCTLDNLHGAWVASTDNGSAPGEKADPRDKSECVVDWRAVAPESQRDVELFEQAWCTDE